MFRIISVEDEKYVEPYVCTIYQIISIGSFFASLFCLIISTVRFHKSTEHATSKILVIYYIFTSFVRATLALYLTVSVLYLGINSGFSQILSVRRIIIVLIIKQRFIPFLMMADWNFRITQMSKKQVKAVIFFGFTVVFEILISVAIALVSFVAKINVPLYFNIVILITITLAVIMTKILYEKAKKLRKQSVLTSSLIERHTFSKMVVFFKRFFPIILIDTLCGMICVSISLLALYVVNVNAFISFCLSFMWLEISTIINSFYATKDILYFNVRPFCTQMAAKKPSTKVSPKEIHVTTMTGKVPIGQTLDEYFNSFNSWIK